MTAAMQFSLFDRPNHFSEWFDALPTEGDPDGLRYYQREAFEAFYAGVERVRSQLIVKATGLGKTKLAAAIIKHWDKGDILFVAHRDELIRQSENELLATTGYQIAIEKAGEVSSTKSHIVVGSVQSLNKKRLDRLGRNRFGLVIIDECFPEGTLVDERPIESIRVGDMVWCIDHATGAHTLRPVVREFKRYTHRPLLTLHYGAVSVTCTDGHPIFVRGKGYVNAGNLVPGDMLCMWADFRGDNLLQRPTTEDVLCRVQKSDLVGDYGAHEQGSRVGADEDAQPHAARVQGQDGRQAEGDRAQASGSEGERPRPDGSGEGNRGSDGDGHARGGPDEDGPRNRVSNLLQGRRGGPVDEGGDRSGRDESRGAYSESARCEERRFLAWVRLDRIESNEPTGPSGTAVYNLEVEGSHTYFANNLLVHNCHHATAKSYRDVLDWFQDARVLGVTATPDRGDEKALGQVFDEVAYVMDIGDGVAAGFLVPIHGKEVVLQSIHLDNVRTQGGDLAIGELDEEMLKSAEGVVNKTIELEPDRQAICFFPGVRSAEFAAAKFNAVRPDSARFISGTTDEEERKGIVYDFKHGKFKYLCNCAVATEGFDAPATSAIVLARPTKSRALYAQMLGRGTRVLPGTVDHLHGKALSPERREAIARSKKPNMVVLDFVGASTRHSLMTAVDVLGGNYTEAEVKLAKKKAKSGGDAREALEAARRELLQLAQATKAKVTATVRPFDPFRVLGLSIDDEDRYSTRFGGKPASPQQTAKLAAWGVPQKELDGLSTKAASKLIDRCLERTKKGLATYKMMRQLQRFGITELDIPFARAKAGINYIEAKGWGDKGTVDPQVLRNIVYHARQPGED